MSRTFLKIAAAATLMGAAASANAGFYYSDASGAADASLSQTAINGPGAGYNNFKSVLSYYGVNNFFLGTSLAVDGPGTLTFTLNGKEAAFNNQFNFGGNQLFTTNGLPYSAWNEWAVSGNNAVNAGVLNFSFCVIAGGTGCVTNAGNQSSYLGTLQSIGIKIVDSETAWLLWDDGGAGPDDNHDDMVIGVKYTSVPEPATSLLFAVGLLGVGLTMRKRVQRGHAS